MALFKRRVLPQCDRISSVRSKRMGRIRWSQANSRQYVNMVTRLARFACGRPIPTQADTIITISVSQVFIFARPGMCGCMPFGAQNWFRCRRLVRQILGAAQDNAAAAGHGRMPLAGSGPDIPENTAPPHSEEPRLPTAIQITPIAITQCSSYNNTNSSLN